jgi:hypothetical protein
MPLHPFSGYLCPLQTVWRDAPPSHGALPAAIEKDRCLLPLPDQEAFWIGVIIPRAWDRGMLTVEVVRADGGMLIMDHFVSSGAFVNPGIRRSDGEFDVLCRDSEPDPKGYCTRVGCVILEIPEHRRMMRNADRAASKNLRAGRGALSERRHG